MSGRSAKPSKKKSSDDPLGLDGISVSGAQPGSDAVVEEEESQLLGLSFHARWIPEKPDHGKWYVNLGYQLTDNFRIGADYRPLTSDLSVLANLRVFSENDSWRPALILGTSNDDFGDISSQSYYGTLSKHITQVLGVDVSLYGGATFIQELDELRPVGGMHLRMDQWSAMFMYSGVDEHVSISRSFGNHTVTFLMFNLELPGLAYSMRF